QVGSGRHHSDRRYLVDVSSADGSTLRAQVTPPRSMPSDLPPGTQVKVEVNARTGEVRFGSHHPVEGFSPGAAAAPSPRGSHDVAAIRAAYMARAVRMASEIGGQAAGDAVAAAMARYGQPGGQFGAGPGQTHIRVTSDNPDVRVVSGADAAEVMREFFGP